MLENFDAVGAWRVREAGAPIDATVGRPGRHRGRRRRRVRQALLRHQDAFVFTLTEKLMIYALARAAGVGDMPVVREIVRDASRQNYRFSSLFAGIVKSVPFLDAPGRQHSMTGAESRKRGGFRSFLAPRLSVSAFVGAARCS